MAQEILRGDLRGVVLDDPRLPLFPLIIAATSKLTGFNLELSGRIASYAAFILTALGLFKLTMFLFKKRSIALLAVMFLVTNRQLIDNSVDCLKETLFIACIIWGNYLILEGVSALRRKWLYYAGGLSFLFIGALFRSTSLIFFCVWLMVWAFRKKEGWPVRAALMALPIVSTLAAWKLFPEAFVFSKDPYRLDLFFLSVNSIEDFVRTSIKVIGSFFSEANPFVAFFGVYGLYRFRKSLYSVHVLLTLALLFFVIVFWKYQSKRYLLASIIWMYPLCAYSVEHALRSTVLPLKVSGIATVACCLVFWAHLSLTPPDLDRLARKESGEWILARLGPGQEILSNREVLVFYARGSHVPLSSFNDGTCPDRVLAIDSLGDEGKGLEEKMRALGCKPDKRFRTISIYLPAGTNPAMPSL